MKLYIKYVFALSILLTSQTILAAPVAADHDEEENKAPYALPLESLAGLQLMS